MNATVKLYLDLYRTGVNTNSHAATNLKKGRFFLTESLYAVFCKQQKDTLKGSVDMVVSLLFSNRHHSSARHAQVQSLQQ